MSQSTAQRVKTREKDARVLELRKAGATFDQIAQSLGYADKSGAYAAYQRAMRETIQAPADELRVLVRERYETLLRAVWPRALQADLDAVDRALSVLAAQRKLDGLDVPVTVRTEIDVVTRDATDEAIARLEAELAAQPQAAGGGGAAGAAAVPAPVAGAGEPDAAGGGAS